MTQDAEIEIQDVSDTALWVAMFRAIESERPDALFHDPLAAVLAGERGRKLSESIPYERIAAWILAVRTAVLDRMLNETLQEDIDTVVNLGAGLDTRPYRMQLPKTLRWIEVDFPHIVAKKDKELRGVAPRCRLERIGLDLADTEARRNLFREIGASTKRVIVLTEGVIPYFTNEQAASLSNDLHAIKSFKYWIQDFRNSFQKSLPFGLARIFKNAAFQFNASDWVAFFNELGWASRDKVFMSYEGERMGRPFPFFFPWTIIYRLLPRSHIERVRRGSGCVVFERKED
jgi:methyltransferase (TIGR00027 family)